MKKILLSLMLCYSFSFSATLLVNSSPDPLPIGYQFTVCNSTAGVCDTYTITSNFYYSKNSSYCFGGYDNNHAIFSNTSDSILQCNTSYADDGLFHVSITTEDIVICDSDTEIWNSSTNTCVCKAGLERKDDGSCSCSVGFALNSDTSTCCDAQGRDSSYAVTQTECDNAPVFIKIDDLSGYTDFLWNECLGICTAKALPPCPAGQIIDSNGYCVNPVLDDASCIAQGGTLQNFRTTEADVCIDNGGNSIAPCCTIEADCMLSDGSIVSTSSRYVSCGNDDNSSTNTDENSTTQNQCSTCPSQYPIPTDSGNCANANGETIYCPTDQNSDNTGGSDSNSSTGDGTDGGNTNDNSNYITCATCSLLGGAVNLVGGWSATAWVPGENGMCKRTTINGITQLASCPTAPIPENNISVTPSDGNATLKAAETDITCPCCPEGTKSTASGKCLKILASGGISMMVPCPCNTEETPRDGNNTEPLDNNGTEDNATGLMNDFGGDMEREIKKAYKGYEIFNTSDCGQLSIQPDAYIGNPEATISDPLPIFRDVIEPYRYIIRNFLLFMAVMIGLFDFFKRS